MNMPLLRAEARSAVSARNAPASVIKLRTPGSGFSARFLRALSTVAARVVPPLVTLALLLLVWELLCNRPGATLPAPTKIWTEARDLIVEPFFVMGPQDIGLGWRVLTS